MNKSLLNSRLYQVLGLIVILMSVLCIRLFVLTVIQEDKWAEAAISQNTKEPIFCNFVIAILYIIA